MDWDAIYRIVEEAKGLPLAERNAFIREKCGSDENLLEHVTRILEVEVDDQFMQPPLAEAGQLFGGGFEGTKLGEFTLESELARGGMGVVYLARQEGLDRTVAIKILPHIQRTKKDVFERFLREVRAASKLKHSHIVPVLAAGETEGVAWYAMPYIDGHDLATELRNHKEAQGGTLLPSFHEASYLSRIVEEIAGIAEALQQVHAAGIVHRDIKPRNILLDMDGHAHLLDFGLAKIAETASLTASQAVQGTPYYMSPEQARVIREPIDHRTDVYSLCVVLYEALALRRPYDADTPQAIIGQIASGTHQPLRKANPRTPRDLILICEKGMSRLPEHRYRSAKELAEDLNRFLRLEAVTAQPPSIARRTRRFVRRHRPELAAAAVLITAMLSWAFASKWQANRGLRQQWNVALQGVLQEDPSDEEFREAFQTLKEIEQEGGGKTDSALRRTMRLAEEKCSEDRAQRKQHIEQLFLEGTGGRPRARSAWAAQFAPPTGGAPDQHPGSANRVPGLSGGRILSGTFRGGRGISKGVVCLASRHPGARSGSSSKTLEATLQSDPWVL